LTLTKDDFLVRAVSPGTAEEAYCEDSTLTLATPVPFDSAAVGPAVVFAAHGVFHFPAVFVLLVALAPLVASAVPVIVAAVPSVFVPPAVSAIPLVAVAPDTVAVRVVSLPLALSAEFVHYTVFPFPVVAVDPLVASRASSSSLVPDYRLTAFPSNSRTTVTGLIPLYWIWDLFVWAVEEEHVSTVNMS